MCRLQISWCSLVARLVRSSTDNHHQPSELFYPGKYSKLRPKSIVGNSQIKPLQIYEDFWQANLFCALAWVCYLDMHYIDDCLLSIDDSLVFCDSDYGES